MKINKLACCIVRDLLPFYIDGVTEPETAKQIAEHLNDCPDCQAIEQDMRTHVQVQHVQKKPLQFLKKIRHTRLFSAAIAAIITLICIAIPYDLMFHYSNTETGRLAALESVLNTEGSYVDSSNTPVHVTAYHEEDEHLFLAFEAEDDFNTKGVVQLVRGINGKYRPASAEYSTFHYTAGVSFSNEHLESADLFPPQEEIEVTPTYSYTVRPMRVILSGYDCKNISFVNVKYTIHLISEDNQTISYEATYPITESKFIWCLDKEDIVPESVLAENQIDYSDIWYVEAYHCNLLDKDSNDVTEQYRIADLPIHHVSMEGADLPLFYLILMAIFAFGVMVVVHILKN